MRAPARVIGRPPACSGVETYSCAPVAEVGHQYSGDLRRLNRLGYWFYRSGSYATIPVRLCLDCRQK
jgi:hypothetical protein